MKYATVFALIIMSLGTWRFVPNISVLLALFGAMILLRCLLKKCSNLYTLIITISLSIIFVYIEIELYQHKLDFSLSSTNNNVIQAQVQDLFIPTSEPTRILLKVLTQNGDKLSKKKQYLVQLYWHSEQEIKQGQIWQIKARLREPYGRANEAGFDSEAYFLANHILAKGSVIEASLIDARTSFRQKLFDWIYPHIQSLNNARYIIALSFGERNLLTSEDWNYLKSSGLAHLLAISGLHIGLAYLFGFSLFRIFTFIGAKYYHTLYFPYFIGLGFALFYSFLAGFSLPTQRALVALSIFTLIRLSGFSIGSFNLFVLVLCSVLIFDPFSVFSTSFWLSFSAVFVLILFNIFYVANQPIYEKAKEKIVGYFKILFIAQLCLILAMSPVMYLSFEGISLSGILYNILMFPWVSLVIVPSLFLSLLLSLFNQYWLWQWVDLALEPLVFLLPFSENHWFSLGQFDLLWLILLVLAIFSLYWQSWKSPVLFASLCILLIFWTAEKKDPNDWQVDVLDVGHGLAVLIEKNNQAILYDTGTAWQKGSIAEAVIKPILQKRKISLSGVILSHADRDHAGGIDWLKKHYPNIWIRSVNEKDQQLACTNKENWQWQGLEFKVLHPTAKIEKPKNQHSCVVRVSDGKYSVLLTGDLPKKQELEIVERKEMLKSDLLIVPHHGSKTSSSLAFLQHVDAKIAIVSTGRYTPWRLPDPMVVKRYQEMGIKWFNTAKQGQIRVMFSGRSWQVETLRFDISPLWYRKMFGTEIINE